MTAQNQIIEELNAARHIVVLTGAGVSAESGIPTFRDPLTGLWQRFDPMELASAQAFRRNPALVWGWYEWRRMKANNSQECRNCHNYDFMDYAEQNRRGAAMHQQGFADGMTCIDCHKGIAHQLPDMTGVKGF